MNILIRSDSSSQIGVGHIMRDLVLATQYPNDTIAFACQDLAGNVIDKIPYPVHILKSNDSSELIELIHAQNIDMVIFDHYDIDADYEQHIKEQTSVIIMSLDDTYEKHHCDILLNHNISADKNRYAELVPPYCKLLCGGEYTLIRDEFKIEKSIKREKIYDVFIAMGGTDPINATMKILSTLSDDLRICIVTTSGNPHLIELKTCVSERKNIILEIDSARIAQLLHQSCLAIITPSVMVHEVLFMEVPFIAVQTAPNQEDMVVYLQQEGYSVLKEWDAGAIARFYNA
ncbi:MAG: UDP-2,4-diacetamido-2,4,6-trideoxy-beta-L-altropyranose hydrolase [Sulfuricurvum sp.]|jgi:UDP-2,4-diacetamido-2,4,6-trideoxy-beta-L-altropyranose hydrolase|uniref:UDP-2,4-diacetamido-2,4, 6-trideoxy-beta-L-altropyranose hydrolase n=1 Tax=Sulfuricurvum sp. TaxID=2025608 RepID=UPI0025EBA479|nr:UDP-2,4-diacetamido-2,4,6-trideoxy-beta-L-altropyranose hydrolase [Sulfuricurvum sp.]MCI4406147.1 UDP-2,4-diacetamido-2,4,6-trideoxy-beta-L-altropyranose hydrolase [Sulfuricurvum sp.]